MPPKRLALFYHIWSPGASDVWRILVDEQIKAIARSGLHRNADIFCCITGSQYGAIEQFVSTYEWINVLVATPNEANYEGETLFYLHKLCQERDNLDAVAYIHTKGIRHFPGATPQALRAINSWRHFLEWGTIDRWRDAINYIQSADVVGVNFRDSPWPHFSGNFWWAKTSYVRTLMSPTKGNIETNRILDVDESTLERTNYEKWIGLNKPKVFSFFDFPFKLPGRDWTFGFNLYEDDIYLGYENYSL